MISKPGVYEMTSEQYHADPVCEPSLSSFLARILLTASPHHARFASPRLNPDFEREDKEIFDLGTCAHAYILEGSSAFSIIDAADWRTKDARAARDAARISRKTPILAHRWADVQAMAEAAERQLAEFEDEPRPFTGGSAEQTLVWQEGDVWCRARTDCLHADHRTIDDLKTGAGSANPDVFARTLFNSGFDVQAAFYLRGLKALFNVEGSFRFIAIENTAPYALSVVGLDPAALELADRKVRRALSLWKACLESGRWPAYPTRTCYAELPSWEEARLMEKELREEGL
jgi:PDDEXK-like uncharacterized protein DUF3799